jgi:transcriptional regulator with GAF, ATPase, and Fis domain
MPLLTLPDLATLGRSERARARIGWLEAAEGGTLYLDAVADLPLVTQGKLLKVLQEHCFKRLGSRRPQPLEVRVVAASDIELHDAVRSGRFRADLLLSLSATTLRVAPLRESLGRRERRRDGDSRLLCAPQSRSSREARGRLGHRQAGAVNIRRFRVKR